MIKPSNMSFLCFYAIHIAFYDNHIMTMFHKIVNHIFRFNIWRPLPMQYYWHWRLQLSILKVSKTILCSTLQKINDTHTIPIWFITNICNSFNFLSFTRSAVRLIISALLTWYGISETIIHSLPSTSSKPTLAHYHSSSSSFECFTNTFITINNTSSWKIRCFDIVY
jgi:hypothetical protein